jgi:hypothetical protein
MGRAGLEPAPRGLKVQPDEQKRNGEQVDDRLHPSQWLPSLRSPETMKRVVVAALYLSLLSVYAYVFAEDNGSLGTIGMATGGHGGLGRGWIRGWSMAGTRFAVSGGLDLCTEGTNGRR